MFDKIMVPIDGSKCSWKALDYAINIAKAFNSKLILVHVVQQPILPFTDNVGGTFIDRVIEGLTEQGREILRRASDIVKEQGLDYEVILEIGQPADTIVILTERFKVDLVVIGSKGISRVKRFLLGGTSDAVVHHVKCPVLIVK